jgi:hypothetical protein
MIVSEYVIRFTQLYRYAPNDVDTDEKKQERFLNGLNDGLAYALEARDFANFQAMMNKAFVLENRRAMLECNCKQEHQGQQSGKSRPHFDSTSAGPIFHPVQQSFQQMPQPMGQGFSSPQNQMIPLANNFQTPYTRIQNVQRLHATQNATQAPTKRKCYNCEERGHIAARCPNPRSRPLLTLTSNSAPQPNCNGNTNPVQAEQDYAQGRVNQ